ncbi:MAG: hypothetical protein ACLQDQ_00405 [Myxococcaceae bacterium]
MTFTNGIFVCFGFLALTACGSGTTDSAPVSQGMLGSSATNDAAPSYPGRNPQAYEPHSSPFGTSLERWSERLWQWAYSVPAAQNPLLDPTGVDCGVEQPDGSVWYLPPVPDPGGTASFTRTCTIPHGRALLMLTSGVLNDYPCPDPAFQPADGQTLFEFLLAGAQGGPDALTAQSLLVDGVKLKHIFDYRETSDDVFEITGDLTLQASLDGCITGSPQPAVSDTFVLMLRPLSTGPHTLVYNVQDNHGTNLTLTYNLTIQ